MSPYHALWRLCSSIKEHMSLHHLALLVLWQSNSISDPRNTDVPVSSPFLDWVPAYTCSPLYILSQPCTELDFKVLFPQPESDMLLFYTRLKFGILLVLVFSVRSEYFLISQSNSDKSE